jgi:hypothetical protein
MVYLPDSQLPKRNIERGPELTMYRRKRVYIPVLAIRVQGEAHLARSHGPAAGLKVHTSGTTALHERAQVRLFFPCTARMM